MENKMVSDGSIHTFVCPDDKYKDKDSFDVTNANGLKE